MSTPPRESQRWRAVWYALLISSVILGVGALAARGSTSSPGASSYFFAVMADQLDTSDFADMDDLAMRQRNVYQRLTSHAARTQADLRERLDSAGVAYTPYYLVNGIEIQGNADLRAEVASRADVDRIIDSPRRDPIGDDWVFNESVGPLQDSLDSTIQPSLTAISAPQVWTDFDVRGAGIIVASADTGVDWTHPSIRERYAGDPNSHDYTWFDAWRGSETPNDWNGHGTHTTGTMVGVDGIGVAPEAEWIGCMNMGQTFYNAPGYLACMQFLFAPFPVGGDPLKDGDPKRGAHVVNNSWGCPIDEGCDQDTLRTAVTHLENAGQFYVVSAGNSGPSCSTIGNPAFAPEVVSVGAVNNNGVLASFSSRGPVVIDGETIIKPEIVAPGVNVISSVPGGQYRPASGTSMAGPHIAGVVALIWSANNDLIGDIEATREILLNTADGITTPNNRTVCGGNGVPNNLYGMGMVNAHAAVEAALR